MKFSIDILNFFGLIICSSLAGSVLYNSYQVDNVFSVFIYLGLGLIWLFCFYQIIKIEKKNSVKKNNVVKYWKSIISILTIFPILTILVYYQQKLNVPTLIKAQRHGVFADFKTDNTFIINSGSWASKVHIYGNYTLHDNIIEIDKCCIDEVLTSKIFLIKNSNSEEEKQKPDYERLKAKKYLVQIDKFGNEIRARQIFKDTIPYRFEIVVDNIK